LLRRAREDRGLTLERIALETKIPQRHLEALERDDLTANTMGFYQRAEIRSYARAVGLDAEVALAYLQPTSKPVETRGAWGEVANDKRPTRPRSYGLIAAAAGAIALAGAVLVRVGSQPAPSSPIQGDPVSVAAPTVPARDASADAAASTSDRSAPAAAAAVAVDPVVQDTTAATESPATTGSVTELVVSTQPAGARVTVNGIGWGVTPVTIRHMPPGEKLVRVSKEGYASEQRTLRLERGRQQALEIQLNAAP
jgi:cytoskeletal protein RodZ